MSMWAIPFALLLLLYVRTKPRANYNPGLNGIPKHAKLIRMSNYLWHVLLKIKLGLLSPLVLHGTPFNMNRNNCIKCFKCMFELCSTYVCCPGSGEEKPQQWNELYYEGVLSFPERVTNARKCHPASECLTRRQRQSHHLWWQEQRWREAQEKQCVQKHWRLQRGPSSPSGKSGCYVGSCYLVVGLGGWNILLLQVD